ncbi:MAG: VanW family protein [Actinobacteria bacterium]|nr:VanW family protein [Actinomycetota bacterium]
MLLRLVVALVVLGGVYGGLATFLSGHVPANARVDGIAIGGMSSGEAKVTLKRLLVPKASLPVLLKVSSRTVDIQPDAAGLEIDLEATLSDLTGFTVNPVRLWARLTETENQPLKFRVDRGKLSAAVTRAARDLDSPVKEGSIVFTGGKVTAVLSVAGKEVKVPETTDAVASAWPGRQVVQAVTKVTQPKVSADEIKRATKELAVPALSAPVKVVARSHKAVTIMLRPRQYAPALSTTPDGAGRLRLRIDAPKLMAALRTAAPDVESPAVDAAVRLVAGKSVVVPATVGMRFNETSVPASFLAALTSSTRTATIRLVPVSPKVTTATARGWRIKEPISTFTTQFPVNPPRTNNIKIAAATLNGTLVRPGDQFSLNATLGERSPAKGYKQAPVIYAGRLVKDYGGGVSQVSTTTFNAAFFAGVRIDQHTPHSFYISRYPEGREATVSWPDVDQKWTNDTGSGILIKAYVSHSDLTVTLWGTKTWDIEAVKGPRRNVVAPKKIVDARPGCVPQLPTPGFDVTVTQIFKKNGAQVRTVPFNTHYIPEDSVRCTRPATP